MNLAQPKSVWDCLPEKALGPLVSRSLQRFLLLSANNNHWQESLSKGMLAAFPSLAFFFWIVSKWGIILSHLHGHWKDQLDWFDHCNVRRWLCLVASLTEVCTTFFDLLSDWWDTWTTVFVHLSSWTFQSCHLKAEHLYTFLLHENNPDLRFEIFLLH